VIEHLTQRRMARSLFDIALGALMMTGPAIASSNSRSPFLFTALQVMLSKRSIASLAVQKT
jgi:hypothetical protein